MKSYYNIFLRQVYDEEYAAHYEITDLLTNKIATANIFQKTQYKNKKRCD